jgi:hypothetical protein
MIAPNLKSHSTISIVHSKETFRPSLTAEIWSMSITRVVQKCFEMLFLVWMLLGPIIWMKA